MPNTLAPYHVKVALENGRECPRTEFGKRSYDVDPTAGFSYG